MSVQTIYIIQVIIGLIFVALVLIQAKGTGLGSAFGGEMGFYRTKRGFEKLLFQTTIVVAVMFLVATILGFLM